MGFVQTGTTLNANAYLTQKGREYLLKNKGAFKIKFFALGDSDKNYNINSELNNGHVPDVTGDRTDCLKSVAVNYEIKYKITK